MGHHSIEIAASVCLALGVLHTFCAGWFQRLAGNYRDGSPAENFFHLLGEVEVVFGLWAGLLCLIIAFYTGFDGSINYVERLNFTEPVFVFVIMVMAATRPVLVLGGNLIRLFSSLLPLPRTAAFLISALVIGSLLGSFITEPAAMTVTALILKEHFFDKQVPEKFKYAVLATLFVNVSIGGTLTHFAAPPVLMVASKWGWTSGYMLLHFGWKAAIAVILNSIFLALYFRKTLSNMRLTFPQNAEHRSPPWLGAIHVVFVALVVLTAHHISVFMGIFLFFIGVVTITSEHQDELKIREGLLVGFFLAGLVVLGNLQRWWLQPLLNSVTETPLFLISTALTAVFDNAALTYLGSQVPNLSEGMQYALVAGAVAGGGLTVIANAPNPAGYTILKDSFGKAGFNPLKLFFYAIAPTCIAMICLWLSKR